MRKRERDRRKRAKLARRTAQRARREASRPRVSSSGIDQAARERAEVYIARHRHAEPIRITGYEFSKETLRATASAMNAVKIPSGVKFWPHDYPEHM